MKSLNAKVGDKGTYPGGAGCEVVYVSPSGSEFVTKASPYVPQVHYHDGQNVDRRGSDPGRFNFVPAPKTVRVAVWLDEFCNPHCTLRPFDNPPHQQIYPEAILTLTVPQ